MACNDYCFNLRRVIPWNNSIGTMYKISNPSSNCLQGKLNCPPATVCRYGIDGWPSVNASATLDGVTTGIGVSPTQPYYSRKMLTAIYSVKIGGQTRIAPINTRFFVYYKKANFNIDISLAHMNEYYNIPIQYIKGSKLLDHRWINRNDSPIVST